MQSTKISIEKTFSLEIRAALKYLYSCARHPVKNKDVTAFGCTLHIVFRYIIIKSTYIAKFPCQLQKKKSNIFILPPPTFNRISPNAQAKYSPRRYFHYHAKNMPLRIVKVQIRATMRHCHCDVTAHQQLFRTIMIEFCNIDSFGHFLFSFPTGLWPSKNFYKIFSVFSSSFL